VEMAHKVLSKDMSDLVNSMKLAQKYNNTTVEGDYRKYVIAHPILTSNCRNFFSKKSSPILRFYINFLQKE
jgi:focal adhesion kinase 1